MMSAAAGPILAVDALNVHYGSFHALCGVSFSLDQQETLAVIGPNGAGKTTLFKAMTGEARPSSGSVMFLGNDVTTEPAYNRTRKGMGRTFQVARVFESFDVLTNIVIAIESRRPTRHRGVLSRLRAAPDRDSLEEARRCAAELGLTPVLAQQAKVLSYGDKKRLELAMAVALQPKILMLDEPTAGMAPIDRVTTVDLIRRLRSERGLAVIITEHDMETVYRLANRILVMNQGEALAIGDVAEIRANPVVREIYLGKEAHGA